MGRPPKDSYRRAAFHRGELLFLFGGCGSLNGCCGDLPRPRAQSRFQRFGGLHGLVGDSILVTTLGPCGWCARATAAVPVSESGLGVEVK